MNEFGFYCFVVGVGWVFYEFIGKELLEKLQKSHKEGSTFIYEEKKGWKKLVH